MGLIACRTPTAGHGSAQQKTQPADEITRFQISYRCSCIFRAPWSRMADEQDHRYLSLRNQSATIPLQHLRYAVVSAEYGSSRRAAEALLTQQSTLSRCIRELEESIGVIVFERSSGGVCPRRLAGIFSERRGQFLNKWMRWLRQPSLTDAARLAGCLWGSIRRCRPAIYGRRW